MLDAKAVAKLDFLMDKLCEEVYLLAGQKQPLVGPQEVPFDQRPDCRYPAPIQAVRPNEGERSQTGFCEFIKPDLGPENAIGHFL